MLQHKFLINMSLTPPKRLFHVPSMSTVMYENVADDVKEKGYVAISHVWGDQQMYSVDELGINSGVDWKVPLSNPNKLERIKKATIYYKKEYIWLDVVCMPQDKQDEINKEIPFMGDYYAGASLTIALSDMKYVISQDFTRWSDMMDNVIGESRRFTSHEHKWIESHIEADIIDMRKEVWLTRVWTLQEAVMSEEVVLVDTNGFHIFLSSILSKISHMTAINKFYVLRLFAKCRDTLIPLSDSIADYTNGNRNVITANNNRMCNRPHDKFYGMLGILGYKDFSVNYKISTKDLNNRMIRYAFSRGDISWISIGGDAGTGFIQPIHQKSMPIGDEWTEDEPGICGIVFKDDVLLMNVFAFGTVVCCKKFADYSNNREDFVAWTVRTFRDWNVCDSYIVDAIMGYIPTTNKLRRLATTWINDITDGMNREEAWDKLAKTSGKDARQQMDGMFERVGRTESIFDVSTIVVAINEIGRNIPLIVSGNASVGDEIKLVEMHDKRDRSLGIVCKSGRRRGVFVYTRYLYEDCTSYQFLL